MLRLLLAALLAFGSEIGVWTMPTTRSPLDWALLVIGYVALSALLLEIAARYRLRDIFGLMTLAGLYGMLNGLILNPQSALIDLPRTLITRAMGAHGLIGLLVLALFFSGRGRRSLILSLGVTLILGAGWATWARWAPVEFAQQSASPPPTLILYGTVGVILIALTLLGVKRAGLPDDLRLGAGGWAFTLAALIGLLVLHVAQNQIDPLALVIIVTLSVFAVMIIWFQKREKGDTLLDHLAELSWLRFDGLVIVFAVGALVGYGLPRLTTTDDPIALLTALFTAYGLVWFPAVTLVLGSRALAREARAMRL